jgi:hypothetical protein
MDFKIIENLEEGLEIYRKFNREECLWNLESVNMSQYDESYNKPYFIVLLEKGKEVGVVPLVYDSTENKYYYFCGFHPENRLFLFDLKYFKEVYDILPDRTKLIDFNNLQTEELIRLFPDCEKYFEEKDKHYFLDLVKLEFSFDKYLETFNSKHRKNLRYDLKKVKENNFKIVWEKLENFDYVVKFNKERFGVDSDYDDVDFVLKTKSLLKVLSEICEINTLTVKNENDEIIGIEIAAIYDNVYYVLNGGYNRDYKNLGKMIMSSHIINSMDRKCDKIDFLVGDSGWKELWNLESEHYYTLKKGC